MNHQPLVIAAGEVLWDLLPSGKQLGGAPANFAYHASQLGAEAMLVSAVGNDDAGREITTRLSKRGLSMDLVQVHPKYPTGTVSVELDPSGKPAYVIHENVAWDYINWDDALTQYAISADAICFGTLAQRGFVSRSTIHAILQHAKEGCLRVLDLNLRQQFYTQATIETSLRLANVLKLNDEEWPVLASMFGIVEAVPEGIRELMKRFDLSVVALTKGAAGSLLVTAEGMHEQPVTPTQVVDTVGAGDSFTAALVMGLLAGQPIEQIHAQASQLAAYVCSCKGAMPEIPKSKR